MKPSISEAEWQVMKVIWQAPPKALPDILSSLRDTAWSQTTIQTYLARLIKKGVISARREGKGYLYSPLISREECEMEKGRSFLESVYDGSLTGMVSGFVKSGAISPEEISQLRQLLREHEENA
jgi:BlaI family penicillinase repressor